MIKVTSVGRVLITPQRKTKKFLVKFGGLLRLPYLWYHTEGLEGFDSLLSSDIRVLESATNIKGARVGLSMKP